MPVERSTTTCLVCLSLLSADCLCCTTRVRNPFASVLPWNGSPEPHQSPPSHITGTTSSSASATTLLASLRQSTNPAYSARNGHSSGRPSAASVPSIIAWCRCPSRCLSTAPSTSPVLSGSTLPCPR